MILVLSFAMCFAFPAKQASANPLAIGGALYLGGAGIYVVGALGVAAVAGLVELDSCPSCQADIEAHAKRTWAGATQTVKDGMQLMVDASVGAWGATSSALTAVDANVNTWVDGQIEGLSNAVMASKYDPVTADTSRFITTGSTQTIHNVTVSSSTEKDYGFFINGRSFKQVQVVLTSNFIDLYFNSPSNGVGSSLNLLWVSKSTNPTLYAQLSTTFQNSAPTDVQATLALVRAMGASFGYGAIASFQTDYASVKANATEAWEEMTDAGLVLPVDNARPMVGDVPLTYDPVTDSYAGIDGVNVPREDITGFDYQSPQWKTLEDLAALGLAGLGAGLYIDGWAGSDTVTSTYNPTTDATTTTTTGTTTSVTTGETATTTTSTTTPGDTTGNPPVNPPKGTEPVNPMKDKIPSASLMGLWELLVALIFYLIRLFTFVATLAFIAPTPIDNPYFQWFTTVQILGITPYPLVQNLALFLLGFSIYKSVRRVF